MSRRDTIILAVLLNTGLLAILFMMAINPDDDSITDHVDVPSAIVEAPKVMPTVQAPAVVLAHENKADEVDNVLKDFAATMGTDSVEVIRPQYHEPEESIVAMHTPIERKAPTPKSVTKKSMGGEFVEVTVKSGDILGRIAQANNTTIGAIKRVNNLTSDRLKIGQVLKVPVDTKKSNNVASVSKDSYTDDGFTRFYTVQGGDNPWKIAKKFNVSVSELLNLNDLDEAKAKNLRPGDRVRVQ
ncbi:MAG: LysM peptidoglycan-binding domain-containing protein [Chlamydiota bacterium]|nr:LysM peptidoglycan-binding domain-containing protein [Chlamydiota bacterium]